MSHAPLSDSFARHIRLSREEEEKIISHFKTRIVRKKHFLLQEGDIQQQLYFVTQGCLRSYSIDKNGFEHILQFAPAGWWIGDMKSLLQQSAATLHIDAVEDSEVLQLSRTTLDQLYTEIPKLERFFRILAENALATYQHRLIDNLSLPAKERYTNFCRTYPSLIVQLPQKYVASYIGVTPEFLSKMLSQQATKK